MRAPLANRGCRPLHCRPLLEPLPPAPRPAHLHARQHRHLRRVLHRLALAAARRRDLGGDRGLVPPGKGGAGQAGARGEGSRRRRLGRGATPPGAAPGGHTAATRRAAALRSRARRCGRPPPRTGAAPALVNGAVPPAPEAVADRDLGAVRQQRAAALGADVLLEDLGRARGGVGPGAEGCDRAEGPAESGGAAGRVGVALASVDPAARAPRANPHLQHGVGVEAVGTRPQPHHRRRRRRPRAPPAAAAGRAAAAGCAAAQAAAVAGGAQHAGARRHGAAGQPAVGDVEGAARAREAARLRRRQVAAADERAGPHALERLVRLLRLRAGERARGAGESGGGPGCRSSARRGTLEPLLPRSAPPRSRRP
jgi:hypothetical protein